MNFLIAKKISMTRRFRPDGVAVPVTVVQAGPCQVAQVKTKDQDGYQAVQIGFGQKRHAAKPQLKSWQKINSQPFAKVHEFLVDNPSEYQPGQKLEASVFTVGQKVKVTGLSKGKGFSGVVKRHHFAGGPASHGHKDNARMPGSIGATFPQHVMKGRRMAGRMGNEQVSVKNLEVIEVIPDRHLLLLKGAVPGSRHGFLFIQSMN